MSLDETLDWRDGGAGKFDIGGRRLEFAMAGPAPEAAPTIVLLHEGLGALKLWRDFPPSLTQKTGFGVFAWSRAGYGGSDPVPPPWPLDYMTREATENLPAVLDAIGVRRAILFGHSDGATIAAIHAGTVSDQRVRGLILMAPHFFTEPGGQASIAKTRSAFLDGGLRERLARHHRNVDATFLGWSGAWLDPAFERDWNVEDALDYIRIPSLAIQGRHDEYGTFAHIEALETRASGPVERVIVEDCRHAPHLEQPEATLTAVKSFLERLSHIEATGRAQA